MGFRTSEDTPGVAEAMLPFGMSEPETLHLSVRCFFWLYWVPSYLASTQDTANSDGDDEVENNSLVFLAVDPEHMPEDARPVVGTITCGSQATVGSTWGKLSDVSRVDLDGGSLGPYQLRSRSEAAPTTGSLCMMSALQLALEAPEGFVYEPQEVSRMLERCQELGGCELSRLAACPMVVGAFRPLPVPPLGVKLCTCCCRRPFTGATAAIGSRAPVPFDEDTRVEIPRKRGGGAHCFEIGNVPVDLLPDRVTKQVVEYEAGAAGSNTADIEVACPLYVYWEPPDTEDEAGELDDEGEPIPPPDALIFVCVNPENISEDALPIKGTIDTFGAVADVIELDGSTKGPFHLCAPEHYLEREKTRTRLGADMISAMEEDPTPAFEADVHATADGSTIVSPSGSGLPPCLFSTLRFRLIAPEGYHYRCKEPSPFEERCREFGGCELQRIMACPVAIGFLTPVR